ncbi:uncharacterized protein LOC119300223 isoform X3 [Triticum dicoccoides]|uniref:uncharacterized protein LOC119300223 isoform X3 n=1 Tax=Triticum dicoccoides TaxID=85692 RepID=UPI00188EDD60|nr:uncharacterized protein LOC119300223 isoform X3 [Triticum dicoccoides]
MEVGSGRGRGDLCTAQESREEVAGRGGAMRTRVCARVGTPQGVGALLLVGGAIVGAAVVAWRRRGDGKGAKKDRRGKEEDVLDGGVVEKEQQKSDQSDENLGREDRVVEADGLDGKEAEELHEIPEQVDEIVADELDSKPTDKFDPNASKERVEVVNDTATEGVKNSDESALTINIPEVTHEEHIGQGHDDDQETASTQMTAHQSQISEQLKVDTMTEIATMENVSKHEEQKPPAQEPVAPIDSPTFPSLPALFKPAEKKRPANTGWNETRMKLVQDGGSKKAAAKGVAVVTMDRRAASMAILAIIFAVTIGANLVVRLYSTLRAT